LVMRQAELEEPTHEPDRTAPIVSRASSPRYLRVAWSLVVAVVAAMVVGIVGYGWSQSELRRAEQEIKAGQVGTGRARLTRLSKLGLGGVESDYWLGICAETEGRVDAALAKWAGIPVGSSWYVNATLRRAHLALEQGRFAVVEEALEHASFPRGSPASKIREQQLQQIDLFTGRFDDLRHRIHDEWAGAGHKAEVLSKHWLVDNTRSFPVDALRSRLDEAGRTAPDDDRVWLGRANLAIRTAQFAEADAWLKQCLARRPEDPAVWQARLGWATASDRLAEAVEAMRHLPALRLEPEQLLVVRAWLAARLGDEGAERATLTRLLERVPGDAKAVARLIELTVRAGQTERASQLRRLKAELDRATDDYRMALSERIPTGQFDELGRLAETLGRWFEARGWWTLAGRDSARAVEARAALARLDRIDQALASTEGSVFTKHPASEKTTRALQPPTVADALADLIPRDHLARAGSLDALTTPVFRDDAQAVGLYVIYENDSTPMWRLPEMMGGGVGLLDYDGDGWLDVYAVQGGSFPNQSTPPPSAQRDRLFRNRRDGTFEDVTTAAGLAAMPGGYGHGVAVADYDNDGRPDLFITRWRSYALYRNRGDGTFEDVTVAAGLSGSRDWPTSAVFADLDGDGDLDLYVCHYADWDPQTSPLCPHPNDPNKYSHCAPRTFAAMPDHVFRNEGGRFIDVSVAAGVRAADSDGRGLGVVAAHLDDDARIDLFVANDMSANFLFQNQGGFRFKETGAESGVATNAEGGYLAGMGVACGDLDGDGRLDLAVTNFYGESTTFYKNLGAGQFVDHTTVIGLAAPSRYLLGFGAAFLDANNDGRLDLATANGHVNDLRPHVPFAMPAQLLMGEAGGRLIDVSRRAGEPWLVPRLGRGLAVGDLDNDGRLDLLLVAQGEPLAYFHNQGPTGHFVTFKLEGSPPVSNRDAVGTRLTLTAAGGRQVAERIGGSSFLSANDSRLHFGLGDTTRIEAVEVRWPSGHVDRFTGLTADAAYLLREGQAQASPLPGWARQSPGP
jgi:enediyne biosynthesis protein E4